MDIKTTVSSPTLRAVLPNFRKVNRKCSPELLKGMHLTLDQQGDYKAYDDILPEFFRSEKASDIFNVLEKANLFVLEHSRVKPGVQNPVARKMQEILRNTLSFQMDYGHQIDRVMLSIGGRGYPLPYLGNPASLGAEFTHNGVRICIVYLPQLPGEVEPAVHAREMFSLLALAQASRLRDKTKSRRSYTVSKKITLTPTLNPPLTPQGSGRRAMDPLAAPHTNSHDSCVLSHKDRPVHCP
jgi:hypothetical protein